MKVNIKRRAMSVVAAAALAAGVLSVGAMSPVQAAAKSTVTLLSTADISSLNSSTSDGNTSYNAVVSSLTGMGYTYYNSDAQLVMNTDFGTMKIVKQEIGRAHV